MAKLFCLKCNAATEYSSSRPKCCSNCGKPFIDSEASVIKQVFSKPVFTPKIIQNNTNDDVSQDSQSVPNIGKIECEINLSNLRPNRENGREVFNQGTASQAQEILSRKRNTKVKTNKNEQKKTIEDFKQQFKNELTPKQNQGRQSTEIE